MERKEIGIKVYVYKDLGESWQETQSGLNSFIAQKELLPIIEGLVEVGAIPEPGSEDCYFLSEIEVCGRDGSLPVIEIEGRQFVIRYRPTDDN
jgi:hypothetical protein